MFVEVLGHRLHVVVEGEGDLTVVLLHGTPTNAQLWRDVVPRLAAHARVVAPDLLGFGASDKPVDVVYDLPTHVAHLKALLDALSVERFVLVAMDLGLLVGLHLLASPRGERCVGVVPFEGFFLPLGVLWPLLGWKSALFKRLLSSDFFARRLMAKGAMATTFLRDGVVRTLRPEELARYVDPLLGEGHLWRLWIDGVGPRQLGPRSERSGDTVELIDAGAHVLATSTIPVRLLTATPGLVVTPRVIAAARERLPRLQVREVGTGKHFLPEDVPEAIADELIDFVRSLRSP